MISNNILPPPITVELQRGGGGGHKCKILKQNAAEHVSKLNFGFSSIVCAATHFFIKDIKNLFSTPERLRRYHSETIRDCGQFISTEANLYYFPFLVKTPKFHDIQSLAFLTFHCKLPKIFIFIKDIWSFAITSFFSIAIFWKF